MTPTVERRRARERFALANKLEKEYLRSLRMLTNQIDHMVKGMISKDDIQKSEMLQQMLKQYSQLIDPWSRSVAEKIVSRIAKKDESNWVQMGNAMGKGLKKALQDAPVERELTYFLDEQVKLIKSLPLEAAERVHKFTIEGLYTGRRASDIAKDILQTGNVTANRAKLIARTEVARTASGLTMVRAQHVGSTHYYWRTSSDGDVRPSHKVMNNKIIAWDQPPEVDPGKYYHAGQFPNCRCYPEPILDLD